MLIRPARVSDAQELQMIYAPYVRDTAITFEYDVPPEAEFARRIENTVKRYPYLVLEDGGEALGYVMQVRLKPAPPTTGRWKPRSICVRTPMEKDLAGHCMPRWRKN